MEDIRDIKGFVPVPHGWWWLWILLGLVAVAAGMLLLKRKKQKIVTQTVAPPTAYEIAMRALQQLRDENPPVDSFYTRLSDIIRRYLETRFHLRAPERTTEEFLYEVSQNGTLTESHKELLGVFLQECDLVKFARHRPEPADMDRAFKAAGKFVEETRA